MGIGAPAKAGPTYGPSLYLIRVGGTALRLSFPLPSGGLGDKGRTLISAWSLLFKKAQV